MHELTYELVNDFGVAGARHNTRVYGENLDACIVAVLRTMQSEKRVPRIFVLGFDGEGVSSTRPVTLEDYQ